MKRSFAALLFLLPLSGCHTTMHGNQSVSGGASTTTTASAVSGSAGFGSGTIGFSSGTAPSPGAPGGQVVFGRGGSAVLILGIVIVDAVSHFASWLNAPKQPANVLPASIADTCSCYGYKPPRGEDSGSRIKD